MASPLLNTQSVIICPHGGMVTHVSLSGTSYRVDGRRPMLQGDEFSIVGCSNNYGRPSPCVRVQWVTASNMLIVKGQPALTSQSVGLCQSAEGVTQGPAIISNTQTGQLEPDSLT